MKNYTNIILIIIIIALLGFLLYNNHKFRQQLEHPANIKVLDPVKEHRDANGKLHEVIVTRAISPIEMDYITDSIAKAVKGKVNTIITTVTKIDTIYTHDTLTYDTITHNYLALHQDKDIFISCEGNIKTKTSQFKIDITADTATYIGYTKKRILRANTDSLDITHTNSLFYTLSGNSIVRKEPKVLFSIGPYIGMSAIDFKPSLGLAITFNLISIKSKK